MTSCYRVTILVEKERHSRFYVAPIVAADSDSAALDLALSVMAASWPKAFLTTAGVTELHPASVHAPGVNTIPDHRTDERVLANRGGFRPATTPSGGPRSEAA